MTGSRIHILQGTLIRRQSSLSKQNGSQVMKKLSSAAEHPRALHPSLSSSVKELVENSLDVGATSIEISLKDFGEEWFQVIDNVETRTASEEVATLLTFNHSGALAAETKTARQVGTTVTVKKLFYNLLVRSKEFKRNIRKEYGKLVSLLNAYSLIAKVTIVVFVMPEGLPLAVTLTLAYSIRKMMKDKALVRRLSSCETMGSATTICTDKTGTLTLNQMTVVEAYVGRNNLIPPDDSSKFHPEALSLINEIIARNSTGNVFVSKDGGAVEFLHVFPFNSEKKRGGVALKLADSRVHILWKGAAKIILGACNQYLDSNGHLQTIEEQKAFFKEAIDDMASRSLCCVAIAYRSYELDQIPSNEEDLNQWSLPEDELVLLAIVGIKDPCRPSVKYAVRICTEAGVKVRMVTEDNLQTAKEIALECGILASNEDVVEPNIIEGKVFRELSEQEREQLSRMWVNGKQNCRHI
ncbi:calcium-transporting ATPase 9, plasma membrane-type [Lathyrus oleraceus]|uniref:calcium-transporting ATPase 9, plasma membrane-type n=1 Tax=Pisum sativum TaxID=3888 RepID=UPI0021D04C56|nr:calcium-transporting ATPase 9, plasma membrane-type-like [Pisum sativum]